MTSIRFRDEDIRVRNIHTRPSRFKLGDILLGPGGMMLKVVTVQPAVPYIENINHYKTVVIFETEDKQLVPVNGMDGEYDVYRR